jgi:NADH:ubiquinone oxidoreductase subunit F (NADH-binding)
VWDEPLLSELAAVMGSASICGLGQAAMNPLKSALKHFRDRLNNAVSNDKNRENAP